MAKIIDQLAKVGSNLRDQPSIEASAESFQVTTPDFDSRFSRPQVDAVLVNHENLYLAMSTLHLNNTIIERRDCRI